MHQIIKGLWRRSYPRKDSCGIGILLLLLIIYNNIDITSLQGIHKTNNTAENTRMHEYIYLKTTKLYILLLHTGVNNIYQATLLFL